MMTTHKVSEKKQPMFKKLVRGTFGFQKSVTFVAVVITK